MGTTALAVASIIGTAYNIYSGEQQKGEAEEAKKKTKVREKKKKDLLAQTKEKSPGQRLLGGRPTLG